MSGGGTGAKWLWGCAVGCLVVLVLFVLAAVAAVYMVRKAAVQFKPQMAESVRVAYEDLKRDHKVPADYQARFDELVRIGASPDTSLTTTMAVMALMTTVLEDGQVAGDEVGAVDKVSAFVREHPQAGVMAYRDFIASNPELSSLLDRMNRQMKELDKLPTAGSAGSVPSAPAEVSRPAEASDSSGVGPAEASEEDSAAGTEDYEKEGYPLPAE